MGDDYGEIRVIFEGCMEANKKYYSPMKVPLFCNLILIISL